MQHKRHLGKTFLALSAIDAYGVWIIIFLFPILLMGVVFLIDEERSLNAFVLSSIAIGIIAASYIFRFYLDRNSDSLRSKVLRADNRDKTLRIISRGFWWWLTTLICAITAAISGRSLL